MSSNNIFSAAGLLNAKTEELAPNHAIGESDDPGEESDESNSKEKKQWICQQQKTVTKRDENRVRI